MDHTQFISELERCILANSSSPPEAKAPTYSSAELANMYLNGDFNQIDDPDFLAEHGYEIVEDEDDGDGDDEEDLIQVIYIDDSNFSKLDPEDLKNFINHLTTILGVNPYSEDEVNKIISQCKKPKE